MVVTDESTQSSFSHEQIAKMAIAGGADMIQFRDKHRPASELVRIAASIREICTRTGARFIVNDRVDVAMAVNADGVHVGQRDIPVEAARRLLGPDKLIGGSASTLEAAMALQNDGADYVGFGHVFNTESKIKGYPPVGLNVLERVARELTIPVIAIGGISAASVESVVATGVHGIAVISAVCASGDPTAAAAEIKGAILSHDTTGHQS
ncbi:MAG: thiamine phosphate synthase [bacterium]|nr:thiamine phosphate synthase [bacterium]